MVYQWYKKALQLVFKYQATNTVLYSSFKKTFEDAKKVRIQYLFGTMVWKLTLDFLRKVLRLNSTKCSCQLGENCKRSIYWFEEIIRCNMLGLKREVLQQLLAESKLFIQLLVVFIQQSNAINLQSQALPSLDNVQVQLDHHQLNLELQDHRRPIKYITPSPEKVQILPGMTKLALTSMMQYHILFVFHRKNLQKHVHKAQNSVIWGN